MEAVLSLFHYADGLVRENALSLLYLVAFSIGFFHFHAPTRRKMMLMKFVACIFSGTYFYLIDAQTAMMAVMIAGLGGLAQACFNEEGLEKTRMLRSGIAVGMALASIGLCAGNSMETLPLLAVINARLAEIQIAQQRIRIAYLFSSLLWIGYALSSGLVLLFVTEHLNVFSNMIAIWREEQRRKKSVLIPVRI